MRIAVDCMGGDYAPREILAGAVLAARRGSQVILVGDETRIKPLLKELGAPEGLAVVHAPEAISMDDQPALALRKKRHSSIGVSTQLVKSGEAQALVSAGSTGAQMAAALLILGRLAGIARPAIATPVPTLKGGKLLLDAGANVDCKPQHLLQFARMGSIYSERVLGIPHPTVGLLNVGTERTKGNELTLATYELLEKSGLNFVGNVEARDIPLGEVDVIVCDGFVGNSLLKFGEGLANALLGMLRAELVKHPVGRLGALLVLPSLRDMWKKLDYSEYGGAPLLGVQGVSIVCHGSSKAKAVANAVRVAEQCVANRFVSHLEEARLAVAGEEN